MKKSSTLLALLLVGTLGLSACNMSNPLAKKITSEQMVDAIAKSMSADGQPVTAEQRAQITEALAVQTAIAEAARKDGMDKLDQTKILLSVQQDQVLMQEYMRAKMEAFKPTDAELKATYDKEVAKLSEYHFRHILVNTEAEANDIIAKLKAGEKFEDLAKKSIDPSGAKGGDLGWAPLSQWVPEFSEAGAKLKAGEFTQAPVKSQFGYHIIGLIEPSRTPDAANLPPFETVKPQLVEMAKQEYSQKLQDGFKPKAADKAAEKSADKSAEEKK